MANQTKPPYTPTAPVERQTVKTMGGDVTSRGNVFDLYPTPDGEKIPDGWYNAVYVEDGVITKAACTPSTIIEAPIFPKRIMPDPCDTVPVTPPVTNPDEIIAGDGITLTQKQTGLEISQSVIPALGSGGVSNGIHYDRMGRIIAVESTEETIEQIVIRVVNNYMSEHRAEFIGDTITEIFIDGAVK